MLDPLGRLYDWGGRLRRGATRPWRAPVPVICVGNLTVGGTGKTPVAITLARRLIAAGAKPHMLTRGYRGQLQGPVRVEPARHDAWAVGDEALLLARVAPTWVSRDRVAGAKAAVAAGAQAIVMDDGFQNPTLAQDRALIVVDGETGFGNGRVLPAGPLREPVGGGLARASALVLIGSDRQALAGQFGTLLPVLAATLQAVGADDLAGRRVLAFAGIGRPAKLFETLLNQGAILTSTVPFPDHHAYSADELRDLLARAGREAAEPVTTAKDAVRLPPEVRARVRVLEVEAQFAEPHRLDAVVQMEDVHGGSTRSELASRRAPLNEL